jgi:LPXTG-motif cell wall-anchored protein
MHWNEIILVIAGVLLIGTVLFALFRNKRDEEEFEQELNENDLYHELHQEKDTN